jgi:ureidoglycolate hydrolase
MDTMMDEKLLAIRKFIDPGYQPVIDFGGWRVAILNYLEEIHPERIKSMERHNETDEVFVILQGQGILFIGEGDTNIEKIHVQALEPGKIYNVKRRVWHTVVLSLDGSVLIVENRDTSNENSSHALLDPEQRRVIIENSRNIHRAG